MLSPTTRDGSAMILVEEISHRVVNQFTQAIASIALTAAESSDPAARGALQRTAAQLRAYAEAHRALQAPPAGQRYDVGEYLGQVCDSIAKASLAGTQIELTLVVGDAHLEAERCWRLGLVVAELVLNAARHGLHWTRGKIAVEVTSDGETLLCRVTDNGRSVRDAPAGRGRALVKALVADLRGVAEWSFTTCGADVLVIVPCEDQAMLRTFC